MVHGMGMLVWKNGTWNLVNQSPLTSIQTSFHAPRTSFLLYFQCVFNLLQLPRVTNKHEREVDVDGGEQDEEKGNQQKQRLWINQNQNPERDPNNGLQNKINYKPNQRIARMFVKFF